VLEPVAEALGNTVAISRKSYVHPKLIDAAANNPRNALNGMARPRCRKWLSSEEVGLLNFLAGPKRQKRKDAEAVEKTADVAIEAARTGPAKVRPAAESASATA
jgi:DNA topoisomerase-1